MPGLSSALLPGRLVTGVAALLLRRRRPGLVGGTGGTGDGATITATGSPEQVSIALNAAAPAWPIQ